MAEARQIAATVVGGGPNGLAAAALLAQAGLGVTVLEAAASVGGGCRTAELTLPGFRHDVCAAVHPLAAASPFVASLPLARYGLRWLQPEIALAHPFDDGSALTLHRSLGETMRGLGRDGAAYDRVIGGVARNWRALAPALLGPMLRLPRAPLPLARFGLHALRPAAALARAVFIDDRTRALFAGLAAHANARLNAPFTAAFGLVLAACAHTGGWPLAEGGSQAISDALAAYLANLGVRIETGQRVASLADLPAAGPVLFDLTPRQLLSIAGTSFSPGYRRALQRFRYGPGVFKIDYALAAPIPWRAKECYDAGTVHLGGSLAEIEASEQAVSQGSHSPRPFVIVAQPSLFDPSRAPAGKHTAWAYCHVPAGSNRDMSGAIEAQIERFAPGFGQRVLARHAMGPADLQAYDENYVGGDIGGGAYDGLQLFFRPAPRLSPYRTSDPRLFICSSSTPPGAGVHGMCGYHAARAALRTIGGWRRR